MSVTMDDKIEWVLERIGPVQQDIVVHKSYMTCGRMKDQDIVCLSLLVSREHCEFAKIEGSLSVIDFGSSNGVYVNGEQIRARQRYMLNENDYVGIGCINVEALDNTMFVYRVKKRVAQDERFLRKQQSRDRQAPVPIPAKMQKIAYVDDDDDDDIEIIEDTNNVPVIQNKIINPLPRQTAKELQKNAIAPKPSNEKINVKPVFGECSSTSNIDIEVKESLTNSAKIIEKTNLFKNVATSNVKGNVPIIELDIDQDPIIVKTEPMQLDEVGTSSTNTANQEVSTSSASTTVENAQVESFIRNNVQVDASNIVNMKLQLNNDQMESRSPSTSKVNNAEDNLISNVKEESCYSQVDEVDCEEDFFPSSQLFERSSVKEEEIAEKADNDQVDTSIFLDDEDDNVITILDSDEEIEDEKHYSSLLQQLKAEPPPEIEPEMIIPDILEPVFHMEIDRLTSTNNDPVRIEVNTDDILTKATKVDANSNAVFNKELDLSVSIQLSNAVNEALQSSKDQSSLPHNSSAPSMAKSNVEPDNKEIDSPVSIQLSNAFDEALKSSKDQSSLSPDSSAPSTSKSTASPSAKPKKKGVKIIEPHHMKPKKRGQSDEHKRYSSDSSSSRKHKKSSSSSSKKSSYHSSIRDKIKNASAHKSSSESKDGETTNDSLNQSASSSKKLEEPEKPKNRTTIVKAKVSSKSRGDMLCESMIKLKPTPRTANKKPGTEPAKTVAAVDPTCIIPRRQVPSGSTKSTSSSSSTTRSSEESSSSKSSSSTSHRENTSEVLKNTTNIMSMPSASTSNNAGTSPSNFESVENDHDFNVDVPPLKPLLTIPVQNGSGKRVSFKENITVKEFSIEPGNSMRNIKDGSKIMKEIPKPKELKIEDFLARVFAWEPCWMEQHQKVKELPPIVDPSRLVPLPNTFNSFEQYYKKMEVLLLLETWQLLLKEYECTGGKYKHSKALFCAVERDSIKQQLTPNRLRYSKLDIKAIVTKDELTLKNIPVFGDMIILEYVVKTNGHVKWRRAFAYVVDVRQQNSLRSLPSSHPLLKKVSKPHAVITYTVQTRVIDEHTVQFDHIARLRSILYLRSHLRAVNGLQCVNQSALRESILHVDIDDYNINPEKYISPTTYQIITKEPLNLQQKEAVIKFTDAATNMKSKIGLLVGPPGTGKSKVITNLVVQILYGDCRFASGNAKRILVCAPSNAAIDEIVLRLLEIRAAIPVREDRFRMVRIGREECMHEEVKKISVTDLARKEAIRQYNGTKQRNLEAHEQKKQLLLKTMKSLTDLMASDPHNRSRYQIELQHKRSKFEQLSHRTPEAEQVERSKLESSVKTSILHGAHIIACTLSSCYNGQMETAFGGDIHNIGTCIVDEATQCCEAETLIPLMLGVKNLILVGDPNQLPATVMSTEAKKLGLDRSLFTRAKEALESQLNSIEDRQKDPVIMLKEQYRMVSAISYWPNKYFYKGRLVDRVAYNKSFPYHPYRILNVDGDQDQTKFSNTGEAVFVGNLIYALMTCDKISAIKNKITIGIVTPYQNQRTVILQKINEMTRSMPLELRAKFETECNTIDSFQGQERDVIIMSCVRSHGIGFLSDPQRLCVALTRAKHTLIICGNLAPFKRDKMWDDLLCDARSRGLIVNLNKNARPNDIKPHVVRLEMR